MLSPSIKSPTPFSSIVNRIIAYEEGDLDDEAAVRLFQDLIDMDMIPHLQGHYGRMASYLIEMGFCHMKGESNCTVTETSGPRKTSRRQ